MRTGLFISAAAALWAISLSSAGVAEKAVAIPSIAADAKEPGNTAVAVFAGGCFWGMEGVFEHVKGVKTVTSGYAGGTADTAYYESVSTETTRHAEAVRIVYAPRRSGTGRGGASISRSRTIRPSSTGKGRIPAPAIDLLFSRNRPRRIRPFAPISRNCQRPLPIRVPL